MGEKNWQRNERKRKAEKNLVDASRILELESECEEKSAEKASRHRDASNYHPLTKLG